LFLLLAAAQIAVPASMIAQHENVLRAGRVYKFKTAPVDPADAFRGRYVALHMKEDSGPGEADVQWKPNRLVHAELSVDSEGFAHIARVTAKPPEGRDYVNVRVWYADGPRVYVKWPIDRYYMSEWKAPQAEALYREHSRRGNEEAYITVRVLNGDAAIEGLYIEGKPIEKLIK
jgi:uncharacterized membrane-anchored protein